MTSPRITRTIFAAPGSIELAQTGSTELRDFYDEAEHRFSGTEWFAVHNELLAHMVELREGVDDPWALYGRLVSRALARGDEWIQLLLGARFPQ